MSSKLTLCLIYNTILGLIHDIRALAMNRLESGVCGVPYIRVYVGYPIWHVLMKTISGVGLAQGTCCGQ